MKKMLVMIVCLLACWSVAQAELKEPAKVLEATQTGTQITIVIEGQAYDQLRLYAFPRLVEAKELGLRYAVVDNAEVKGVVEGGNTKFTFKRDDKRPRCNFHKGDTWANLVEEPKGVLGVVTITLKNGASEPSLYIRDTANTKHLPELEVTAR